MLHPILEMIHKRQKGIKCGIPSYCSANELVLEAALERAKETGIAVLVEATANQVNQFGGYTGMNAQDFKEFVYQCANRTGCARELIILGGDHLGPLTWKDEPEADAMEKAKELVRQYTEAGFTKIHLDTSMKLLDDPVDTPLDAEVIAKRGVCLYAAAIEAYEKLKKNDPNALRPVFVIGSEVPIPGGAKESEESIRVTTPEDFADTVTTYKRIFCRQGYDHAWEDVIAVVVQPGVEFGDDQVFFYDRQEAGALCSKLKEYPEIVLEGHSTDYQSPKCLREMNEDGIAILKVGPALTFGLREALFSLSMMEKEILPKGKRADFIKVLDQVMLDSPQNWEHHYHGDESELAFARKYSYSDRSRYYLGEKETVSAIGKLFENLSQKEVPMSLLHQYMPLQYEKVRDGRLTRNPKELAKDVVKEVMKVYEAATR